MGALTMTSLALPKIPLRSIVLWTALLAAPLAINLALYAGAVKPLQLSVAHAQTARELTSMKPALEASLAGGHEILTAWRRSGFSSANPAAVMQALQQLATTHGVHVVKLDSGTLAAGSAPTLPVELVLTGRYGRLAHWLEAVESRPSFRIASWSLAAGEDAQSPEQLTVKLTALLRGES